MLVLPDQRVGDPVFVMLSPLEAEAKSSVSRLTPPPPPPPDTIKVNVAEPVPAALEAEIAMLKVPATVGVPAISPVEVLTESPSGKPVALNEVGLLLAAIW
jgi:hypothetical protein